MQSSNFSDFRTFFRAKLEKIFVVPANTFDNVTGNFPIGFFIWDSEKNEIFKEIVADVFDKNGLFIGTKTLSGELDKTINKWIKSFNDTTNPPIGLIVSCAPDFQHNNQLAILSKKQERYCFQITANNIIKITIYFASRHCIKATWLNDRDQFLYPNDGWQTDLEFQNDCFTYTLFNTNIQSKFGVNHWIPFTEQEVNAKEKFESNFMTNFITGKLKSEETTTLFGTTTVENKSLQFSDEATAVFDAGRKLWKYYHAQNGVNVNASLYDIREYFQGRNEQGRMNAKSNDETYTQLIGDLREKLNVLATKIKPKVYEYGFLKE